MKQIPLFDSIDSKKSEQLVLSTLFDRKQNLTKSQKTFIRLTKQLEEAQERLTAWQTYLPIHLQLANEVWLPLYRQIEQHRRELVLLLDRQLALSEKQFKVGKIARRKMRELLIYIATDLLIESSLNDDEISELKAARDRHTDIGFDEMQNLAKETAAGVLQEALGIEMGEIKPDHDFDNFFEENLSSFFKEQEARQADLAAKRAKRKPTAKQLAKESARAAAEKDIHQSVRQIARKLALELHPDRETDSIERERKTKLMQRVNLASDRGDLLELLRLQLEIEQIDAEHILQQSEERMRHFVEIIRKQIDHIKTELYDIQLQASPNSMEVYPDWSPDDASTLINYEIQDLRHKLALIQRDIDACKTPETLKILLKSLPKFDIDKQFDSNVDNILDMAMMRGAASVWKR